MINLRLSFFCNLQFKLKHFKCSESVFSENNHALLKKIVLMYSKVVLIRNSSFQEKFKTKVYMYALEDSLGVFISLPTDSLFKLAIMT